jgi:hypothetical protein
MRGRYGVCTVVAVAAMALIGWMGLAVASGGGVTHPTTIKLVAKVTAFGNDVANPNSNNSTASSYALSGSLWNASQTHRIGRFDVACTSTTPKGAFALCDATFTLRGRGEISTSGVSPQSGAPDTDPITGGDGAFRNVRGQADIGKSSGTTIKIMLELQP